MSRKLRNHNVEVDKFFNEMRRKDPERYKELAEKTPIMDSRKWKRVRDNEVTFSQLHTVDTDE